MGPSSGFALNEPAFCVILNGTTWAKILYLSLSISYNVRYSSHSKHMSLARTL